MESVVRLEPRVDSVINTLVTKLDQLCGQTIDLGFWLQMFAFGIM